MTSGNGNVFKSCDIFGAPIGVNYRGSSRHNTTCGGCFSMLAFIVLTAFTVVKVQELCLRSNASISSTAEYINYATDSETFNMKDSELDIIIKFEISRDSTVGESQILTWDDLDDRYGRVKAFQVEATWPLQTTSNRSVRSVADLYLDASIDSTAQQVSPWFDLPLDSCFDSAYYRSFDSESRNDQLSDKTRKCVDLTNANIAGGTQDGDVEKIVVIEWQHCYKYAANPATECASQTEFEQFMREAEVTLEVASNYVKLSEEDTSDAIQKRLVETLLVDTASAGSQNVKGYVDLAVNEVKLMDLWYSVYPDYDTEKKEFLTVDDFRQYPTSPHPDSPAPDFGFTFVLKRSSTNLIYNRKVYTILELLSDVGGLANALVLLLKPLISFFVPSMATISILNSNFSFDVGNYRDKKPAVQPRQSAYSQNHQHKKYPMQIDQLSSEGGGENSLLSRLRSQLSRIAIDPIDLNTFKRAYMGLQRFQVDFCDALGNDKCLCLTGKDRSIKNYRAGKAHLKKRLDVVKLIRTSMDIDILKKLYLLPRQRALYKKQRRHAIKVDTSSSSSAPSEDSDRDDMQIFEADTEKSILKADFRNTTDRRLLLGILTRDNDLKPRKEIKALLQNAMQSVKHETSSLELTKLQQTQSAMLIEDYASEPQLDINRRVSRNLARRKTESHVTSMPDLQGSEHREPSLEGNQIPFRENQSERAKRESALLKDGNSLHRSSQLDHGFV